jgi:hypothetical protein
VYTTASWGKKGERTARKMPSIYAAAMLDQGVDDRHGPEITVA